MKKFKFLFLSIFVLFTLNGCQDVKKGFSGKKIDQGNEFLVIKKNPLVVPPNFNELPKPKSNNNSNNSINESKNNESDFKKKFEKKNIDNDKNQPDESNNNYNSIEENILEQIRD